MSDVTDAIARLRERGAEAAAESAVIGEWLLLAAGLEPGPGNVTVAPGGPRDRVALVGESVSGVAHGVPWLQEASQIALLLDGRTVLVASDRGTVEERVNLAGERRDTVTFERAAATVGAGVAAGELFARGALARIALMAGALERVYRIAIEHSLERRQFGRPIGSFQAVQEHLVTIAQQSALVAVAADASATRPGGFEIAAGKLLANRAALSAGRAAHQVLGARGTTREHPLSGLTRSLWAWRSEYGDEHYWSTRLGEAAVRAGADRLYPAITGGSTVLSM